MKDHVRINAHRTGYEPYQVGNETMTVGELIEMLEEFDEDMPVVISNDNGYTFGAINDWDIYESDEWGEDD